MEDGPTLGDLVPVWQAAYGSAFQITPDSSGVQMVTISLDGATLQGTTGPEQPAVVDSLWRRATDCVMGD